MNPPYSDDGYSGDGYVAGGSKDGNGGGTLVGTGTQVAGSSHEAGACTGVDTAGGDSVNAGMATYNWNGNEL